MKKQILTLAALAGLAMGATLAHSYTDNPAPKGSAGGGIVGSKHDMNFYIAVNGGTADAEGRVCAYCHTPHHANGNELVGIEVSAIDPDSGATTTITYDAYTPLWSRQLKADAAYTPYQSATFNPAAQGRMYDNLIGPSRLCMTCHDGVIAADSYYGEVGGTSDAGDDLLTMWGGGNFAVGLTHGLGNDHPIGFKYDDYRNDSKYELKDPATSKFNNPKGQTVNDVLFTDLTNTDITGYVTCASCHDVHNGNGVGNRTNLQASGRGYFLLDSQKESAFCIVCHDKNS